MVKAIVRPHDNIATIEAGDKRITLSREQIENIYRGFEITSIPSGAYIVIELGEEAKVVYEEKEKSEEES